VVPIGPWGIAVPWSGVIAWLRAAVFCGDVTGRPGTAVRCGGVGRVTVRWVGANVGRATARGAGAGRAAGAATRAMGDGLAVGAAARATGAGLAAAAAGTAGFFGCCACATVMKAKDAAADKATKAVVLAANMPADPKQRRPRPLRIALGIAFAGCEQLSMVMLSVFLSCAVRVSLTGTSGTDETRGAAAPTASAVASAPSH